MFSAWCWSVMCLDCTGQDLRKILEWKRDVHLHSDFHTAFREPQRVVFICDGKMLRMVVYYTNRVRTYFMKKLEFRMQKMEVGRVFMELEFLRQYLDYAAYKGIKLHVTTNETLGVVFFQGPPYGFTTMVDAFFIVYGLINTELVPVKKLSIFGSMRISSPRMQHNKAHVRKESKSAWASPRKIMPLNDLGENRQPESCLVEPVSPKLERYRLEP
jgi:hypothetical protein